MKRIAALILFASLSSTAVAMEPFVVSDIRIDGLHRISAGTVYTYLTINKGQPLTTDEAQSAIRALYQTKMFSDVTLDRDGNTLVIKVVERPSIAKLNLRGNHDIKEEDLRKGLKSIGLAEGETFDRLSLDRVQQELISQYYNRGKYNVGVIPHVTKLDRNRVAIDIEIREGKVAKVREINIIGNHDFTDRQIRTGFKTDTANLTSWYSKNDQYSREKLSGDLKTLQSYYMDRGYADFALDSSQVTISQDRRSAYIDTSVKEGEIYTISDIHLLGQLRLPEKDMRRLVFLHNGDLFNRRAVEASSDAMKAILANIGYAYAKVTPVPKLDHDKRTVDLTFYVEPGPRVYVRRIVFEGNTRTEDQVLRRQFRQLEGGYYNQLAIDRTKVRLQQLGFFKTVDINKERVAGVDDEVDLHVKVAEQSAGSLQFGVGYSQYAGIIISASVTQNNIMGTGDKFSISASKSYYYTNANVSYYNPYVTESGIGLGYNLAYSKSNYGDTYLANFETNMKSFSVNMGIPITDWDGLNFSLGLSSNRINTYDGYTPQVLTDYINKIGKKTDHSWDGTVTWTRNTKNNYWAPTHGGQLQASITAALPGSTVQYIKFFGEANHYWPVGGGYVLYLDGQVGYGKTYGKDSKYDFPFWENFYSGGVNDVRGFQQNTLGPRYCTGTTMVNGRPVANRPNHDGYCANSYYDYAQPIGGAFKVLGSAQLFLPLPFLKDINTARVAWFVDTGNAYATVQDFNVNTLRVSTGISLQWQAPIGPLVISFAVPVREQASDKRYKEQIQFTFGSQF